MPRDLSLIGCGRWGKNLARVFDRLGALHTIYDPNYEGTAPNLEAALDHKINKVVIATPSHMHFELVQIALEAGKDVFVEKPMCLNVAEAETLCRLSQKHKRILMVGHLLRYHPSFVLMENMVRRKVIGTLESIHAVRLNTAPPRPEGVVLDLAVHDLSMALALIGGRKNVDLEIEVGSAQPVKQQELMVKGSHGELVFNDLMPSTQKLKLNGRAIASSQEEPLELECRHFLEACVHRSTPRTDAWESLRILDLLTRSSRGAIGSAIALRNNEVMIPR